MIKNLYETHVEVSNLEASIEFYQRLGLHFASIHHERKVAFFWIGAPGSQMLGVWEVPEGKSVAKRHFAFGVDLEDLNQAKEWLAERGIAVREAFGRSADEPIVHTWMPAAAIYFTDLDDNSLEFIAMTAPQTESQRQGVETLDITANAHVPTLSEWLETENHSSNS